MNYNICLVVGGGGFATQPKYPGDIFPVHLSSASSEAYTNWGKIKNQIIVSVMFVWCQLSACVCFVCHIGTRTKVTLFASPFPSISTHLHTFSVKS